MLAQSFDEVVDADGLLSIYAAVARCAVLDYQRGPDAVGERHFETAKTFLEQSGLLHRLPPSLVSAGPRQLGLFDGETR